MFADVLVGIVDLGFADILYTLTIWFKDHQAKDLKQGIDGKSQKWIPTSRVVNKEEERRGSQGGRSCPRAHSDTFSCFSILSQESPEALDGIILAGTSVLE